MENFVLSCTHCELIKCLIIDLSYVIKTFTYFILPTLHMNIDKGKTCLVKAKSDSNTTFITCHTLVSCFYFAFLELSY